MTKTHITVSKQVRRPQQADHAQVVQTMAALPSDAPLTLRQAAAFLQCDQRTIQRFVKQGRLMVRRVGRRPRFLRADLLKVILPNPAGGAP